MLGLTERPPSPSLSVASDLGEVSKRNQGDEELRCVIAVLRHGMQYLALLLLMLGTFDFLMLYGAYHIHSLNTITICLICGTFNHE